MKRFSFIFFLSMTIIGCQSQLVNFKINDNYVGPCVVFIYKNLKSVNNDSIVALEGGLGRTTEKVMTKKFYFTSSENNSEIQIISIGEENIVQAGKRYIFALFKGTSSSECIKEDLNLITFYVGTRSDFIKWQVKYTGELDYFDSTNVNWCEYYKNKLE